MSLSSRKLPRLPILLTELSLGGAQIGNHPTPMTPIESFTLIKSAWKNGIRVFDTAPLYGYGLSEVIYGEVLKLYPRDQFILSTKVGRILIPDGSPKGPGNLFPQSLPYIDVFDYTYDGIKQSIYQSLERLQMSYIDIAHIHDLDVYTHGVQQPLMMKQFLDKNPEGKTGYDALIELRENGIIRAIGVGSNNWECCLEIIEKAPPGFVDCIELSNRYTLFEQRSLEKLFLACRERNIKVMIAGPLNSGILSSNPHNTYYNYSPASKDVLAKRDAIEKVCLKHGISLREAALQFLLLNPHVVTIVGGMRTPAEVEQNVQALKPRPLAKLWKELKVLKLMEPNAFTETSLKAPTFLSKQSTGPVELKTADVTEPRVAIRSRL